MAGSTLDAVGTYQLVRSEDGRFMIDVWADLFAPIGHTHGPRSSEAVPTLAGRVLAEHVFTRPFAPPGHRRVTSLDFDGAPDVRETRPSAPGFESIASVPDGATRLDPSPRPDSTPIIFGLFHTDGNMHVNSLAYLRIFEEAGLRRFVELGRGSKFLGRSIDIAYRKPCFVGQVMRVVQQAFEADGKLGIAAALVEDEPTKDPEALARARPYVFARMTFER